MSGQKKMEPACSRPRRTTFLIACLFFAVLLASPLIESDQASAYYWPPTHVPPGPPPNYSMVDTSYFIGAPSIPLPPPDSGGFYIYYDTTNGCWTIANHIYSKGGSLEQFHGSVLALLDEPPQLNVNVFVDDFELWHDTTANRCLQQNDRWGWVAWDTTEGLYEIWWDVSTKEYFDDDGDDANDFMKICLKGCAIDFNIWSSGHEDAFSADEVFLGADLTPLSSIAGYSDLDGVDNPDAYQAAVGSSPEDDPNTSVFTPFSGPGESYNVLGLITTTDSYVCDASYGSNYAGAWVYEGDGLQFSTDCPPVDPCADNQPPVLEFVDGQDAPQCPPDVHTVTFSETDADGDTLTCSNTNTGATLGDGTWEYSPYPGEHVVDTIICCDPCGLCDTLVIDITFPEESPAVCEVPADTTIFQCTPTEVCLPAFASGATCSIISGPGTLVGSDWCYTPSGDETVDVTIECSTDCDTCTASFSVTFTIGTPPSITCPSDLVFECDADVPACDPNDATVTGGSGTVTVSCSSIDNGGSGCSGDPKVYTYTYIATDSCGKADTCTQTITVEDTTPPVITCPDDITVDCIADVPAADINLVTADDNCGSVTVTHEGDSPLSGSCPATITRTYRATDECGNFVECTQTITVNDQTAPTIACPADVTVDCAADIPAVDVNSVTASDNCGSVTVTHVSDVSDGLSCPETITRTYRATDDCGNTAECIQTITIEDTTDPTIACPADITVDCVADVPAVDINLVTASDNCGTVTVTHEGDSPLSGSCPATITRTYRATDECGNFVECTQTITVDDQTDPTIACPADITVDCEADVPAADINLVTASDNCGSVTVTHEGDTPLSGGACGGTILRTYRATDECGNFVECTQTITVNDQTDPTITCPADLTVECVGDIPPADINTVTASDNCGTVTVTHEGDSPISGACPATITRTYRATDECGNFVECTQTITINDQTDPTIACPADMTVDCEADVPAPDINLVTASDNCGSVTVTHEGDTPLSGGPCGGTITRTYRATDACGNFVECTQTITVNDQTAPTIACPADVTVDCAADIPAVDVNSVTASDNCGSVTVTHVSDVSDGLSCPETITRTYRATDDCGNTAECIQTITIEDTTDPTIACPADITVDCVADVPAVDINLVTASDNCGTVTVTHEGDSPLSGSCPATITRTYRATDECGNFVECTQTITVDDQTDPTIACPADITVDCEADVPAADINLVTASDNCGSVTVTHEGDTPLSGGACGGTILRTYRATDECGNFVECTQTITVNDQTDPTITCPADLTVECVADIPPADINAVTASDNCGTVTVTHEGDSPLSGSCPATITRTYRATDECGNFVECTQTITVDDQTDPTIACPADITVDCEADVPAADINLVTASDNCGSVTVTHEGDTPLSGGACGGTILRTYRATDACGNFVECTQTITINDQTDPTIACPADITVDCEADVPAADINLVTADDNCGSVTVTHEGDTPVSGGACGGTILRTYRATDECGNFVECTQTITVNDQTDPTITCPADLTVECVADIPPADINAVTASDNCGTVTVTHEGDSPLSGSCPATITRTYRATDECGNFVECTQTITVDDQTDPTIACPADITVDCEADVPAADINLVTASDNCGSVTVTHEGDTPLSGGACGGTILRTYRATDECGNFVECTQTITVNDQTDPTITCPADLTVECVADIPPADINAVTASDNCGTVTVTHEGDSPLSGSCPATITRTYRATDECGNFVECTQTITINDQTDPTIACPADITVDCVADVPAVDINLVTASDNCGLVTVTHEGDSPLSGSCPATITRTYRATDACGNFVECTQTITVDDQTDPTIACPANTTVECEADIPPPDINLVTASDNCGSVTITHEGDSQLNGGPCGGTITRTYRATDACGNFVECTQTITIDDTTPPTCSTIDDASFVQCAPEQVCIPLTATDNCAASVNWSVVSGPGTISNDQWCYTPSASEQVTVTVRAEDDCGNGCEETFTVTFDLNSAPVCDLPSDTSFFLCSPGQICLPVSATDVDGNLTGCQVISGPGSIAGGHWCYNATTDESFTVTVECTDDCGQSCQGSFDVDIDINDAPVCSGPGNVVLERCDLTEIVLNVGATDDDGNLSGCQVISGPGTVSGGVWTFTPPDYGEYCVTVECTDACGATCQETFCVTVEHRTDCNCLLDISVNGGVNIDALNDQTVTVPITIDAIQAGIEVGGFDLLLCYDQTAIQLVDVARGLAIEEWEYFTYRHGINSNCVGTCPSGIVRLVGIADLDNGPTKHPSEGSFRPVGTITELSFYVTPDRNFIGQCVPISFCTYDCGDNTVSSRTGDTLYVDLYNFDLDCQNNPKSDVLPSICFLDASICIQEPPDDRGDLNLNFIANEVGDAVLYSRFFVEGDDVWDPVYKASQILASDVNDDGVVLTVADLIYMIRIITGDAQPFPADPGSPKLAPYASTATASLRIEDGRAVVSTTADVDLGGAFLVFRYSDLQPQRPILTDDASPLKISSRASSGEMRVLVSPEMTGKAGAISSGSTDLLDIPFEGEGSIELTEVQFSDANGAILSSEIAKSSAQVPTSYQLYQNYPNPFNAGTVIRFDLQDASDWSLTVYNVTGQRVRTFHGHSEASQMTVQWDGRDDNGQSVASGVYFYNIKAGSYTDTRKMTLLK